MCSVKLCPSHTNCHTDTFVCRLLLEGKRRCSQWTQFRCIFTAIDFHHTQVSTGEVNMTIGGYAMSEERSTMFSLSNPYMQSSSGFCYKENEALLPFSRIMAPFELPVWILICVLLFVTIIVILLSKKFSRKWRHFFIGGQMNRTPILNTWASLLGMSICNPHILNGKKIGTFARTLMLLWIVLWFIIRNSYQAALYTYLQSHRLTSAYDTIEKVRMSDCKVITPPSGYSFIKHIISVDR